MHTTEDGYSYPVKTVSRNRPRYLTMLNPEEQRLLLLAGLTLVDGVFVSAMAAGAFSGSHDAVSMGINLFSGAGSIAAAFALRGGAAMRLRSVLKIYGLYLLPGALIATLLMPLLRGVLMPGFEVFSALVLVGIALELFGIHLAPESPRPERISDQWSWSARLLLTPQIVIGVALLASLLHALQSPPVPGEGVSFQEIGFAGLAVFAGCALTGFGAVAGALFNHPRLALWIRRGGAAGLVLIAARILGAPVPSAAPLLALGIGLLAGVIGHQIARLKRTEKSATTD